jgi:flagellar basal body rod protein FlgC
MIKNFNIDLAIDIALIASLKLNVISNNIANVNTIDDNGMPYIRRYVKIGIENDIQIVEDIENNPNVNLDMEILEMVETTRLYEFASEYLKTKNYNIL